MAGTLKQRDKSGETGFILWEVLALAFFLSAVAVGLLMYQTAAKAKSDGIHRLTALYLAQTEFSHLERAAATGTITTGVWDWRGEPTDLELNGGKFVVSGEVVVENVGVYLATVRVTWQERGRNRQITLERLLATGEE